MSCIGKRGKALGIGNAAYVMWKGTPNVCIMVTVAAERSMRALRI